MTHAMLAYVLNELETLVVDVAIGLGLLRIVPMRRPRLFFALYLVVCVATALLRGASPCASLFHLVANLALLLSLGEGSLRIRLLGTALGYMPSILGEALGTALWIALTDSPSGTYEGAARFPLAMLAVKSLFVAEVLVLSSILGRLMDRVREGAESREVVVRFLGIPIIQSVLVAALLYMQLFEDGYDGALSWGIVAFAAVFLVTDLLALRSLDGARRAVLAKARARAKERELDEYLRRYEEVTRAAAEVARVRHDARGHLQVVLSLLERGEADEAARYAAGCAELLPRGDEGGRADGS